MAHISGPNTAYDRMKMEGKKSSDGIMYPSHTNERGYPGREAHSRGDVVGGIVNKNRAEAVKQIRNETGRSCHASGDKVEAHKFGSGIKGDFKKLGHDIKKGFNKKIANPTKNTANEADRKMKEFGSNVSHGARKAAATTKHVAKGIAHDVKREAKHLASEGKRHAGEMHENAKSSMNNMKESARSKMHEMTKPEESEYGFGGSIDKGMRKTGAAFKHAGRQVGAGVKQGLTGRKPKSER